MNYVFNSFVIIKGRGVMGNLGFLQRFPTEGRGIRGNLGFLQKEGVLGETLVSCKRKGRAGKPWFPAFPQNIYKNPYKNNPL